VKSAPSVRCRFTIKSAEVAHFTGLFVRSLKAKQLLQQNLPQAATVGAIEMLSFEMVVEKLVQAVTCIVRCRAIVFQSVIKNHPAGWS